MADWQREVVAAHPAAFLRGLFHSDGARVRNWATRVVGGELQALRLPALALREHVAGHHPVVLRGAGPGGRPVAPDVRTRQEHRRPGPTSVAILDEHVGPKS